MLRQDPFDVKRWMEAQQGASGADLMSHLKVWDDQLIVMLFHGATPAQRSDFHINTAPELFYQLSGEMFCRLVTPEGFKDVVVGQGELFYIPPLQPHLNRREEGSLGLVIHQKREPEALDGMMWFCNQCAHPLHRVDYRYTDLQANLRAHIRAFLDDEAARTCPQCGDVFPPDQGRM